MATRRPLRLIAIAVALLGAAAVLVVFVARWDDRVPETAWEPSVLTLAGDGMPAAVDGDAARARFVDPFGVAVAADGTIYVGDGPRLRRVARDGSVSTLADGFGWLSAVMIDRDDGSDGRNRGAERDEAKGPAKGHRARAYEINNSETGISRSCKKFSQ